MEDFKKQYRDLEQRVIFELRQKVEKSEYVSKTNPYTKVIKLHSCPYTELAIINDTLTFLDVNGMHYSIFAGVTLEELIDILG